MKKPEISAEEIAEYAFQQYIRTLVWEILLDPTTIYEHELEFPEALRVKKYKWEPLFLAKVKEVSQLLESNYKEYLEED